MLKKTALFLRDSFPKLEKGKKVAKLKCAEGDWQAGRLDHEMSRKIRVGRFPDTGEPRFAF